MAFIIPICFASRLTIDLILKSMVIMIIAITNTATMSVERTMIITMIPVSFMLATLVAPVMIPRSSN